LRSRERSQPVDPVTNNARVTSTMWAPPNPADPMPLHEQVAATIRRAIADGEAQAGERLPPARDLAAVLKVNHNTVLRALRDLRDEGLLEFRRGRGVMVTGAAAKRSVVVTKAQELVRVARRNGYHTDELVRMIREFS